MKKIIKILFLFLFFLTSCNNQINYGEDVPNNYLNVTPNIQVEKTNEEDFTYINVDEYKLKIEANDSFICLFFTSSCRACKGAKEKYLLPYLLETGNKIYALDVYNDFNYPKLLELKECQGEDSPYIHYNQNNQLVVSRPTVQIIKEGKVVVYEMGLTKNILYMLEGYCL